MKNLRSYYSAPISTFLSQTANGIVGIIHKKVFTVGGFDVF